MSKFRHIKVTAQEIIAIKDAVDTLSAMAGAGNDDFDDEAQRASKAVDAMLKRNKLKPRDYA